MAVSGPWSADQSAQAWRAVATTRYDELAVRLTAAAQIAVSDGWLTTLTADHSRCILTVVDPEPLRRVAKFRKVSDHGTEAERPELAAHRRMLLNERAGEAAEASRPWRRPHKPARTRPPHSRQ